MRVVKAVPVAAAEGTVREQGGERCFTGVSPSPTIALFRPALIALGMFVFGSEVKNGLFERKNESRRKYGWSPGNVRLQTRLRPRL